MPSPKPLPHRDVFEKLGETQTRFDFAGRTDDVGKAASAWLFEQQAIREEESSNKRDAREEETLEISRKALSASERANDLASEANDEAAEARSVARRANIIAIIAAVFATTATISAAVISVMFVGPK